MRRRRRRRRRRRTCATRRALIGKSITCSKRPSDLSTCPSSVHRVSISRRFAVAVAMSPARAVALRFTFALSPARVARARRAPVAVRRASLAVRADGQAAESGPLEERVDLRVGRVLSARKHEEAEKLVRVRVAMRSSRVMRVVWWCWVINLDAREGRARSGRLTGGVLFILFVARVAVH